ncbi:MAG TPA: hypothetical protein VFK02_08135 [Kofleriaceae bacterium]|nr:hypothetical protein [Kofleriaceae bacterium]
MRRLAALAWILVSCHRAPPATPSPPEPRPVAPPGSSASAAGPAAPGAPAGPPAAASELLTADTPKTTVSGNSFVAPAQWTYAVRGPATILEAPEAGSRIALVDVPGKDADAAVAAAWAAYRPDAKWPLKQADLFVVPPDPAAVGALAAHYTSPALGELTVQRAGATTVFDFGEWKTPVATRKNPDGTVSFVAIAPGLSRFELVVGSGDKRTLILRDAQHAYTFTEH